jgi:hypothetical protein
MKTVMLAGGLGMDSRASVHEKRSECEQGHPPHGFIADLKKSARNVEVLCLGKNTGK